MTKMELLTKEFLESKLAYYDEHGYGKYLHRASFGNIYQISDKVFTFPMYNFLPGKDGQLDGHYTFFVNVCTFEYLIYRSSYYGGFTYTTPSDNTEWVTNLIEREKIKVESIIAHKLLMAYYQNRDNINGKGDSLIKDSNSCNCIICDYRGYIWCDLKPEKRDDHEVDAIRLLEPEYVIRKVKSYSVGKIENKETIDNIFETNNPYKRTKKKIKLVKKSIQYLLPINIVYADNTTDVIYIQRYLDAIYFKNFTFLDRDKKPLQTYPTNEKSLSKIVKIVPEFIESL